MYPALLSSQFFVSVSRIPVIPRTYEGHPGIHHLQEVNDVWKLERNKPSMFSLLSIIIDEHCEDNTHIHGDKASSDHQEPLCNVDPR
jgi:hypothetical protein